MRASLFALFLFILIQISNGQNTQGTILDREVSISFVSVSLPSALRQLNKAEQLDFSYNSSIIPRTERITKNYQEVSLRIILKDLLEPANLYYREVKGIIVILKNKFNEGELMGIVVDKQSQEPLPFANVFIDKSTLGAPTDQEGYFYIQNIPDIGFELVVSYVGYKTVNLPINLNVLDGDSLRIVMEIDPIALESISVVSKATREQRRDKRKLMKRFESDFLGGADNASECRIVNEDVLEFEILDSLGNYKVISNDVLFVENEALGYRVGYLLEEFRFENGFKTKIGKAQFAEMEPGSRRQNRKWEESREIAYAGSLQHFLNALIRNELKEEGFKVNIIRYDSVTSEYSTPLNPKPVQELLQVSQTGDEFLFELVVEEDIEVTYINEFESSDYKKRYRSKSTKGNYRYTDKKARSSIAISDNERLTSYQIYGVDITDVDLFQKSIIFFEEKKLQVGYPGFFLDQRAVAFGGWWVWEGFSEMLPVDYLPSTK